jgi:predicted signal transduction protein with EAL and GGDEF domain
MVVPWTPPLPQVTISLGVFTFNEDTKLPADLILRRADEALYQSKANGRNRTTVSRFQGLYYKAQQIEKKAAKMLVPVNTPKLLNRDMVI